MSPSLWPSGGAPQYRYRPGGPTALTPYSAAAGGRGSYITSKSSTVADADAVGLTGWSEHKS